MLLLNKIFIKKVNILLIIFIFMICCENEKQRNNENLAASVYDSDTEASIKIFTPEVIGKKYSSIIEIYGKPSDSVSVNSSSAKGRMPKYLVNYFNSSDSNITAKIFRWKNDSLFREISFKQINNNWYSIGGSIINIKAEP